MATGPWLSLAEASRRLGVHPNTLRNWEKTGLLHMVRLPGSRHRRVPESEVARLEAEMCHDYGLAGQGPQASFDPLVTAEAFADMDRIRSRVQPLRPGELEQMVEEGRP